METLPPGSKIKIESLKEESGPGCFVVAQTGSHANEVFATSKPSAKPAFGLWEVFLGETSHSFKLKNLETGLWLCSSLPAHNAFLGNPSDQSQAEWLIQNRSQGDKAMTTVSSLDAVWFKSVKTGGYLSARVNETWTVEGKLWTRDSEGAATLPFSWEKFSIHLVSTKPESADLSPAELHAEVERLSSQLAQSQSQNAHLTRQLEEYKQFFALFKQLSQK